MTDYDVGLCLLHSLGLEVFGTETLSKRQILGTDSLFRLVPPASQAIHERPAPVFPIALCTRAFDRLILSKSMIERAPQDPAVAMAFA